MCFAAFTACSTIASENCEAWYTQVQYMPAEDPDSTSWSFALVHLRKCVGGPLAPPTENVVVWKL
jgi:hypothetical protein